MYTSSSRGSKRKADKNVDADFTSCLALGEGKTRSANQDQKTEKPIVPSFRTRHSRFFSSVSNTDNNSTTERLIRMPLGACSLVVWQCIAFATSFLLASQTTSVAATASCMTTSFTTTKLSHFPFIGSSVAHVMSLQGGVSLHVVLPAPLRVPLFRPRRRDGGGRRWGLSHICHCHTHRGG